MGQQEARIYSRRDELQVKNVPVAARLRQTVLPPARLAWFDKLTTSEPCSITLARRSS
jgi:hypothetical protein